MSKGEVMVDVEVDSDMSEEALLEKIGFALNRGDGLYADIDGAVALPLLPEEGITP